MRPLIATVVNFGSYEHLSFDFSEQGLALVSGQTGSGKSTLEDITPWILYGITAKNGSVDDVRRWGSDKDTTQGILDVELPSGVLTVVRTRGKSSQNDLYFFEGAGEKQRGTNIQDTQRLLEERLGVSSETYLSSAYFNEFSSTGTFFQSKTKTQRELFENIADLSFPVSLAEKVTNARKIAKKSLEDTEAIYNRTTGILEERLSQLKSTALRESSYANDKASRIRELQHKVEIFEETKRQKQEQLVFSQSQFEEDREAHLYDLRLMIDEKLADLEVHESRCTKCLQPNSTHIKLSNEISDHRNNIKQLKSAYNKYDAELEQMKGLRNHHRDALETEQLAQNPYTDQIKQLTISIWLGEEQKEQLHQEIANLTANISSLNQLYDLSFELRGQLLKKAVKGIETETNRYLEKYFDAEIRVGFDITGADKLKVTIQKSGHDCTYTQLSKGQRCLLKLCFSVSVMLASANKAGVHMDMLAFDESCDGLDSELKIKAFGLFSELSLQHSTVLVVEHSEDLKNLFERRFNVELIGDCSRINEV